MNAVFAKNEHRVSAQKFRSDNRKGKDHLGDLSVDRKIILNQILK
jgi:hypothetical protein